MALVMGSTYGIGVTTAKHILEKGYNVGVHGTSLQDHSIICPVLMHSVLANIETVSGSEKPAQEVREQCNENDLQLTVLMGYMQNSLRLLPAKRTEEKRWSCRGSKQNWHNFGKHGLFVGQETERYCIAGYYCQWRQSAWRRIILISR